MTDNKTAKLRKLLDEYGMNYDARDKATFFIGQINGELVNGYIDGVLQKD